MKRIKKISMVAVFSLFTFTTIKLINADNHSNATNDASESLDKSFWQSLSKEITLGAAYNSGNTDSNLIDLGFKLSGEYNKNIYKIDLGTKYGENKGKADNDQSFAKLDIAKVFVDRIYTGLNVDYLRDNISDIDYKISAGPTLGYFLIKNDTTKFDIYVSPSYVFEKIGGLEDEYFGPKIGENFIIKFKNGVEIFQNAYVGMSIDDTDNYYINAELGISAPLADKLSMVVKVTEKYNNQPAAGSKKDDTAVTASIAYKF